MVPLIGARQRVALDTERQRLGGQAHEIASRSVTSAVTSNASDLVVTVLRPALDELLKEARPAAVACQGFSDAEAVLRGPDKAQKGYLALGSVATRYAGLRSAQRLLSALAGGPQKDTAELFSEIKNMPTVWPDYRSRKNAPWPADGVGRLRWLATSNEAEIWMPSVEEQDEAWDAVFGEAVERQRATLGAARAMAGVRF